MPRPSSAGWQSGTRVADAAVRRVAAIIARRRVAAGFVIGVIVLWLSEPTTRSLAIGAALAIVGEAVRIWATGHLEKGREVTTSGPYALTRHPLYVGSSLIAAGIAVMSARLVVVFIVVAYLVITIPAAISTEEAELEERFGTSYGAYRDGRAGAAPRQFSPARVMRNREYRALVGLAIALALLTWKTAW